MTILQRERKSKYSISFDYDNKRNPLFNIAGFKELLNQNDKIYSIIMLSVQ
jgi:hypothetical protein